MHKITPCLWFKGNAEQAVHHYLDIFPDSRIEQIAYYGEAGPGRPGSVLTVDFVLAGQPMRALNGESSFAFSPALSLSVDCADQGEVDDYWQRLSAGGHTGQCGWLTDRYGVSWQIVPSVMIPLLTDPDPLRSQAVMRAMLGMTKLDIAALQQAYHEAG